MKQRAWYRKFIWIPEKNIAYAFSTIRKSELREGYARAFRLNHQRAEQQMSQLTSMSLPRMMILRDDLTQLRGQGTILKFLGIGDPMVDKQIDDLIGTIEDVMLERSQEGSDLEEALITLKSILFSTLNPEVKSLKMNLLTYKDSELSTALSLILDQKLSQVLLDRVEINDQSNYVLSGTFWPVKEGIRIMINVNEFLNDENLRLLGTASATVGEASINHLNVEIEPAVQEVPMLTNSESKPDYGGLIAEVTTQKGKEAVAFWEGEELKVAVKVSRPSYVQLINIWADGSKYLLLDNYYLGPDEVNKEYWLPFSWETACPCGMENLYLRASNQPFPPVQVTDVDGFLQLDTDIDVILELTRGFKPKKDDDYLAETSLGLMTFPR